MTRDEVIALMKATTDSYLAEAQDAGIPEEKLWAQFHGSMFRGIERFDTYASRIARTPDAVNEASWRGFARGYREQMLEDGEAEDTPDDEAQPNDFDHLKIALIQIVTSSCLLLEMLPPPRRGVMIATVGRDKRRAN